MLKPFHDRVIATYALMTSMIGEASTHAGQLLGKRQHDIAADLDSTRLSLDWKVDTTRWDLISFKGYQALTKTSAVTGLSRLYYDHDKPFEKPVRFYDYFVSDASVTVPSAYLIPQGWHDVVDLLQLNGVKMRKLAHDTTVEVEVYHIADYRASPRAYEKHHKNTAIKVTRGRESIHLLKGDYLVPTDQPARRFLVEMLEPTGEDSYFAWNFFDAILQEKEGYSAYRWEDVAEQWLKDHPDLRQQLEERKRTDSVFARSASQQLNFVYRHSPYYEPAHMRYPVYRLLTSGK
jgi:hypothetical protein